MSESFADYAAIPAINASAICAGRTSMLHMHEVMQGAERPDTPAMSWGRKVHAAILEPERFFSSLALWEGSRRAGKEWAAFLDDHPDTDLHVTRDQLADLQSISASIYRNADAESLLLGALTERTVQWRADAYGPAKGRIDALKSMIAGPQIIDIKTTRNIEPAAFFRSAYNLAYHVRMGWYAHGCNAAGIGWPSVHLIVVESSRPWDCWVTQMPDTLVHEGEGEAVEIATRYHACSLTGRFPGIGARGVVEYEIPAWAGGGDVPNMEDTGDE